jgi:glutamate-1-semialdehyde 2,1-aminomutase
MARVSTLLERARGAMPGGVSSPVRAFGAVGGDPPIIARGRGAEIFDADGRRYVDLVQSFGPLILGHAHPAVLEAVARASRDGLSFGATCELEIELAEALLARYPFAERVRFVSSGTEAVMSAVRLARGATGRERIAKFEGCYHGHADGLLVRAGSGLATFGIPSSAGVPAGYAALTDVLPLDDEGAASALFETRGGQLAAVLIEPIPANAGLLVQRVEFLRTLRELCSAHGTLLVFDEVISGLRVAPGGATELYGIEPDLVVLGKVIGGGMPVGAYAGPARWMKLVAPEGPVYQAGTLSGNPVSMAAGLATLRELERSDAYARLEATGAALQQGFERALARHREPASVVRVGSIVWIALQPGPAPRAYAALAPRAAERLGELHRPLLEAGLWLAPSAYEVAFASTAHGPEHVARAVEALDVALARSGARTR